jgi:epoxide hydrolase-like predicted phosphatase
MIRNIIFDLGNVLLSFLPSQYFEKKNYPENIRKTIVNDIFKSREWKMLDNGDITVNEAIDSLSIKSTLKRQEIALIFNLRTDIMFPLTNNVKLLPALKKRGFSLYYLSNFPLDIFEEVKNSYYFFRYFDGGIISAEVKLSKPDARIFSFLLNKYSLEPEECLYLDDIEENVLAAESVKIRGITTFGSENISGLVEKVLLPSSLADSK